jgi:hypothetical protein
MQADRISCPVPNCPYSTPPLETDYDDIFPLYVI